jgi:low temperature requirement protein LtrA
VITRSRRPTLRYVVGDSATRKVTWLELFFDLVFVAAVAQVAAPLGAEYTVEGLIRFAMLFVLIWWAWLGSSVFATRFDAGDVVQRLVTLVQMFGVAVMAANATEALDSRSSAGFAAAYALMRVVLVVQYARARRIVRARSLATRYMAGHGLAAVLWLASAFTPPPLRFGLWAVALVIDLGTPWVALAHSAELPPDASHLPERFGLFTLILLGESVVAVMRGMESQEEWTASAALSAFLGMTLAFAVWWWYFERAKAASEQHVGSHQEAVRFHIWSYAHLPLYLGIAMAGVGVERIVHHGGVLLMHRADAVGLLCSLVVLVLAMLVITTTSTGSVRPKPEPGASTVDGISGLESRARS